MEFQQTGSSSVWDVLSGATAQYFETRRVQAQTPPPVAPLLSPGVSSGLQQLLPLLLLVGGAVFLFRALK